MTAKRNLRGQVVVITGAGNCIGLALAKGLAERGQVIGTDAKIILWIQRLFPVLSIKFVAHFAFSVTSINSNPSN